MDNVNKYLNLYDIMKVLKKYEKLEYEYETIVNVMASIFDELSEEERKFVLKKLAFFEEQEENKMKNISEENLGKILIKEAEKIAKEFGFNKDIEIGLISYYEEKTETERDEIVGCSVGSSMEEQELEIFIEDIDKDKNTLSLSVWRDEFFMYDETVEYFID